MPGPTKDEIANAKALLASSQALREDLLGAVGKLDSYIEQLREVVPPAEGIDERPRT
ncbi:hypothetical protein GCM10029976_091080 [Kribbella albertanoniae]|uniref:hypothetical protein n=1 Tax=Kribbella albertanoniae TaxID=1266829 RepID=UPI00140440C2|nr:hypothetical protein [Kribbella albertanoniae]